MEEINDSGSTKQLFCQCCGMPLEQDIIAREPNGEPNENYCKWCYHDGTFTYHTMDELIDACIPHMVAQGFLEKQARAYMKTMLPNLKYWKEHK